MSVIKDQARIDEMRRRLYERGGEAKPISEPDNQLKKNNFGVEILSRGMVILKP